MSHDHEHSHSHAPPKDFGKAFIIGILLNTGFIAIEAVMGFVSDSLALLSDAGHNLADVLGLVLAWGAAVLARRPATRRYTYGLKRTTILAALANAILLLLGVGAIALEAINRLREPATVEGGVVAWVAGVGILVNGFTAWLFMAGRKDDLNVRGAFLHMAADAAVSLGVMISGLVILWLGWEWVDPVVSLVVVAVILWSTWGLFTESLGLSLDAAPGSADVFAIQKFLEELPDVKEVHHLHVWALSTTETALTVHLVKRTPQIDDNLLAHIREELAEHYRITHPTIQFESIACGDETNPNG